MTKLYHHKTDGGAEYLCLKPIEGTDEGDLHTAIVRLDGEPELLQNHELLQFAKDIVRYLRAGPIQTKSDKLFVIDKASELIERYEG